MEHAVSGDFSGGKLTGSIDMIVTNATGKEAVIDIKWGGFKYRRASFEEDNYLQLATYAHMRQQSEKMWPVLAYFIIDDARMLALDTDYFPAAVVVKPISEESTAALWQRIEQTWKWRRQQLDKGLIEVSVDGTEPSEESAGGVKCLTMNTDSPNRYNDFEVLTLSKAYIND
jgi:RecB family exonuclease